MKPSICIAGRRRSILNETYRITYRIVQGAKSIRDNVSIVKADSLICILKKGSGLIFDGKMEKGPEWVIKIMFLKETRAKLPVSHA